MFNPLKFDFGIQKARRSFARFVLPAIENCYITCARWADDFRRAVSNCYGPQGKFQLEHWRNGELLGTYDFPNGIVDVGLNHILGVQFNSVTQVTTWYIGIIDNSGFSAYSNADTMASHAGWNEFTTYSEGTRQTWGAGTAAARAITNASPATFSINGSGTLKGIFVTTGSAKSGTTGTLWSTASFASTVPVTSGDSLKVTYTVSG